VDDRAGFLTPERFPQAQRLVPAAPSRAATAAGTDANTYAVVMSHNFLRDQDYLRSLLSCPVAYVGVLGPRARLDQLLAGLASEGLTPSPGMLDRVYGPAGVDIGAEDPEEIAWSIVAEILAVSRHAGAGHLRDRTGPIHPERFVEDRFIPAP
jgi:xanthine dehydrogenase accessory factor